MPGEERHKKVRGSQKGEKGKGSGAPNPLLAVMVHVPKVSAKGNTKGASHTQAEDMKGASHAHAESMKGASHTRAEVKKGASHTQDSERKRVPVTPRMRLHCCENVATPATNFFDVQNNLSMTAGLTVGDLQGENP